MIECKKCYDFVNVLVNVAIYALIRLFESLVSTLLFIYSRQLNEKIDHFYDLLQNLRATDCLFGFYLLPVTSARRGHAFATPSGEVSI